LKKNFSDDREALTKEGAPFETPSFLSMLVDD
jgi:hypothetical protein